MMNDFDRTLELIQESQNSAGAAAEQYAIYQDSAAAATARLTAAWEEFYSKIINSEQIIWVINTLEKLVETMSKIGPVGTAIGTTIGALGLNTLGKVVLPQITKDLATAASTGQAASITLKGIISGGKALSITFGKVLLILAAITAAVYVGIKAWKKLQDHLHKDEIQTKKLAEEINNLNEQINKSSTKVESLEKLMDKYNELNHKIYLTKEEQDELNSTINEINEISDRAVISIDKQGNAHLNNATAIQKEIDAEKALIKFNSEKKFKKTQQLLEQDNLTPELAREAGLPEEYIQALENYNDKDLQRYNLFQNIKKNRPTDVNTKDNYDDAYNYFTTAYMANDEIKKYFEELANSGALDKYLQENFSDGRTYEGIKTLEDYNNFIFNNSLYKEQGLDRKLIWENGLDLLQGFFDSQLEGIEDSINLLGDQEYIDDTQTQVLNEELKEHFGNISKIEESGLAFFQLMNDGLTFSQEQIDYVFENYDQFYKDNQEAIDKFNASNKTQEDIDELISSLQGTEDVIGKSLVKYAQDIHDEAESSFVQRSNQRGQFWRDNIKNLNPELKNKLFPQGNIQGAYDFRNNDKISSSDLDYLGTFLKLNISDESKISLFDFIITDEDDQFQALGNKYIKSVQNGITDESEQLKQQIIDILTLKGVPQEDIIKILGDFVPTYSELMAAKADEDFSDFNTTRKGAADLTSLKSKQREQFLSDNSNADQYFEYNEEGEEYLNILGKIVLLEQQRSNVIRDIDSVMATHNAKISENEIKIEEINGHLDEASDEELSLRKTLMEENESLREQNQLQQKRRDYINESVNLQEYEAMALQSNVNEAQKHADNIEAIAKAWGEYQKGTKESNLEAISTLNQLDASYQSLFMTVSENGELMLNLNQDIVDKMINNEKEEYQEWRKKEIKKLQDEKEILIGRADALDAWLAGAEWNYDKDAENKEAAARIGAEGQANAENKGFIKGIDNATKYYQGLDELARSYFQDVTKWAQDVYENITNPSKINLSESQLKIPVQLEPEVKLNFDDFDPSKGHTKENEELAKRLSNQYRQRAAIIESTIAKLGDLSPEFQKTYDKAIADTAKGNKEAEKTAKALTDAIDDLSDALEDLDKLLIDINRDLKDISLDYNPFLDLFEAWEKEWDYYYNIKRLIAQIGTQGQYIDNIISADYVSADKRVQAYHAKIGNLLAQMAANDAYIEALRTGMSQTAVELMDEFGDYYKVDPATGQIYQTDKNLTDINETINQTQKEIYNLTKMQNEKENDLALENAKLDALEKEKSAYEEILSTIESQIDSLKDNEDITVNLSELEDNRATLKANIEFSRESIDDQKQRIRDLEDEIQDIEVNVTLKQDLESKLEDYVSKMEDKVSEYEEYWENLNSTIAEQQELLQSLNDIYSTYVDTAISTQQDLYNAIVENYQREIDQKKKEYDELKKLDNDYLNSIKDNINKEREAREDSKKQKSYQQSIQRAQLLQMDTSGAYRTELANLKNTIEDQRQELYDDLVDKQVKALEKEIEERHKLYDKEVEALEQRLAYYQENAILLWEMVNTIVAEGSDNMMATLEGTMDYINSSELSRQQQRKTWENNVKMTFDGVKNGTISMLNSLIQAGNNYITQELPKINKSLDEYNQVFINASETMSNYNAQVLESLNVLRDDTRLSSETFKSILDSFMTTWNARTNEFTAYAQNWADITASLKEQAENNLSELKEFYTEEGKVREENLGSIRKYNDELERIYTEMYNDFLNERSRYRDELESLVSTIRSQIEAAVKAAADAIRNAAGSISANTRNNNPGNSNGGNSTGSGINNPVGSGGGEPKWGYTIIYKTSYGQATLNNSKQLTSKKDATNEMNERINKNKLWASLVSAYTWHYKAGGLADFTGPAWLDGTKTAPERILSPKQTKLFESMVSSLERASNNSDINSALGSSYNIGDINTSIQVAKLDNQTDINKLAKQVEDKIVNTIRNRVVVSM